MVLLAAGVTGCSDEFRKDEPNTAVRDFLSLALAQQNGQRACDYMTAGAQRKIARLSGEVAGTCRTSFEKAELAFKDGDVNRTVGSIGDVKDLTYKMEKHNAHHASVTVTSPGGKKLDLVLVKKAGIGNLYVASNPWRIKSGAEALVDGSAQ